MKDNKKASFERLNHIKSAIIEIEKFTHDINISDFLKENILSSAVLFQFSVIGEAIIHVDSSILDKYEYTWYKIRAFRNLISHEYFNIKLEAVWNIIVNELPELKLIIDEILNNKF